MANKNRFYISYPLRTTRMNPRRTRLFYIILAVIWFVASIYLFINNPTGNILFPVFYFGVGVGIVILSIYYERIIFGLYIDIGTDILELRLKRGKSDKIPWDDIGEINFAHRDITLTLKDGNHHYLSLRTFRDEDWQAFRDLMEKRAREKEIPVAFKT